ncbi:voltage-gated potassium channel subunit beta, putative [Phytophthora infestans T30-4]|uniref:Voltage-gated potassium channel subunit beta, putative n=1 Tax=Phytophthora infestans (strain T30-4) TaxID=403677 RepID=D0NI79_PHYIT|nr:voltage-gated potassium channel subunit beta, putative [Phytophthora infestans T30-4]EEY59164.1 voltage-gated potassium channel subunit beta, putative [Phytophthora infestans T30-4]|eukprot:XP_002901178.1 voltage-gated potassium channel subunit beta, putative [Phytophthora infestans T30-4]
MEFDEKYTVVETAFEGVNFIDTAEVCGLGQSEKLLGGAIQKGVHEGVFSREDLIISTKIYFGCKDMATAGTNGQGSTRKHILEGTQASLGRLGLDYVDVIFCHRPDPFTPVEETVRAMNYVINKGWAFYWGTIEWLPSQINEACEIADRLNLIRPKSQYNIFERSRVEYAYVDLYKKYKLGLTTWSPLAFYRAGLFTAVNVDRLGCCERKRVDGAGRASRPSQLKENLEAMAFVGKITPEVKEKSQLCAGCAGDASVRIRA